MTSMDSRQSCEVSLCLEDASVNLLGFSLSIIGLNLMFDLKIFIFD